jgi:RES domain-containing protein
LRSCRPKWAESPAPARLQAIGHEWMDGGSAAALRVPSAIVKVEFNHVLNTRHPDFGRIKIGAQQPFQLDPRLPLHATR